MPKLERRAGKKLERVELLREGTELVVKTTFATPALAEHALSRLLADKIAKGWKRVKPPKPRPQRRVPGTAPTPEEEDVAQRFLRDLDAADKAGEFPFPLHDRMDYAGMRVHAYRGKAGYALLVEMLVFDREVHRIEGGLGFCNHAFVFYGDGRRISWNRRILATPIARTTNDDEEVPRSLLVRRKKLAIDPKAYRTITTKPPRLADLLRVLVDTHRKEVFANDIERAKLLRGMYKLISIDAWHYRFARPSKLEAMQLLAKVLATNDASLWRPKEKPNTDWRTIKR